MATLYDNPVVLSRIRQCLRKRKYKTEERAWEVCKKLYRKHGDLQWAFRCGHCRLWHTGHPQNPYLQQRLREAARTW